MHKIFLKEGNYCLNIKALIYELKQQFRQNKTVVFLLSGVCSQRCAFVHRESHLCYMFAYIPDWVY